MVPGKILGWRLQVKRIMGSDVIVDVLPDLHRFVERSQIELSHVAIMEFLGVRSLRPFYVPVELGRPRGKHEHVNALLCTSLFELGLELTAAVHLDRLHRVR